MASSTIIIGGDCYFDQEICKVQPHVFFDEKLRGLFLRSDLNILNLEAPVYSGLANHKIVKTGPHIKSSTEIFPYLKYLNIHLLTLANNHIYDYGKNGLDSTLKQCAQNGIDCIGAGLTLSQATKVYYKQLPGTTVALINMAENEWSGATIQRGGANPFDMITLLQQIKEAKKAAEYVFVIMHGGHEYYALPSPRMVKLYRFLIDQGANGVFGHHSHYFSGHETYKKCPVIYGLGNFVFRSRHKKTLHWHQGALARITLAPSKTIACDLIPYMQNLGEARVRLMNDTESKPFSERVQWQSEQIESRQKLHIQWEKRLKEKQDYYLSIFSNANFFPGNLARKLAKRLNRHHWFLKKENHKELLNALKCESHLEISVNVLQEFLQKRMKYNE